MKRTLLAIAAGAAALSCAPALREPPGVELLAGARGPAPAGTPSDWVASADSVFAARSGVHDVARAEALYLRAAAAESTAVDGLIGAVRTKAWLVEHEPDAAKRQSLAVSAVQAAQWCGRRAPGQPACDYWLAVALGLQAREKRSTAEDGLKEMVAALRRAIERAPTLDRGGPHRVLALLLLRAPGWPLGPGDPEEALEQAGRAVAIDGAWPPNLLALAEARAATGDPDGAKEIYRNARAVAESAPDPDAPEWIRDAEAALAKL